MFGSQSRGKGVGQDSFALANGGRLIMTTFEWLTPKGRTINGTGITPDEVVPMTDADVFSGRDPQLDAAAEYLRKLP